MPPPSKKSPGLGPGPGLGLDESWVTVSSQSSHQSHDQHSNPNQPVLGQTMVLPERTHPSKDHALSIEEVEEYVLLSTITVSSGMPQGEELGLLQGANETNPDDGYWKENVVEDDRTFAGQKIPIPKKIRKLLRSLGERVKPEATITLNPHIRRLIIFLNNPTFMLRQVLVNHDRRLVMTAQQLQIGNLHELYIRLNEILDPYLRYESTPLSYESGLSEPVTHCQLL
ncbi:hypothetical protein GGR54DRAFT_634974 [Hypoxylon sp. NC1633]|nr:hypothetical protein GGR54DRAFT_634974 [Hypoxylon sp. NC1633]